jgi:hypothetical protein
MLNALNGYRPMYVCINSVYSTLQPYFRKLHFIIPAHKLLGLSDGHFPLKYSGLVRELSWRGICLFHLNSFNAVRIMKLPIRQFLQPYGPPPRPPIWPDSPLQRQILEKLQTLLGARKLCWGHAVAWRVEAPLQAGRSRVAEEVIEIPQLPNPSSSTMAVGFIHPLTELCTRRYF